MGKGWNDFETHESKSFDCLEQNVGRAMHVLETALKEVRNLLLETGRKAALVIITENLT